MTGKGEVKMDQRKQEFRKLLSPCKLGKLELKNRFIFLPHYSGLGTNNGYEECGLLSERNIMHYVERAKGGAAAVTVSSNADPESIMATKIPVGSDPRNKEGYRRLAEECHKYGCKVIGQFNNGGHTTLLKPPQLLFAPSQMPETSSHYNVKELEIEDLESIKDYFVQAAVLHKEAGWDAVEIKVGHDGLLRTFLSPLFNKRTDQYGGSYENMIRYPMEVYQAVRNAVGDDFTVGIRLCMDEFIENGYSLEQGLKFAKSFEEAGVDYISTDAGSFTSFYMEIPPSTIPLGFAVYMSAQLKKTVNIPVIAFGRINDPVQAEMILQEECADFIGMCRQLNCDAETPNKTMAGDIDSIRHCIACNEGCLGIGELEICCIQNPASGREKRLGIGTLKPAEVKRNIMVVGAGVSGLKWAEIAAKRGHHVEVYEKSDKVGGQILLAEKMPYRAEIGEVYRYLKYELKKANVPIHLNTEVTAELVDKIAPDVVVVATGSYPLPMSISGAERFEGHILDPRQVLESAELVGENVLLYDDIGYWQAAGVADYVAALGAKLTAVAKDGCFADVIGGTNRVLLMQRLYEAGATIISDSYLSGLTENGAEITNCLSGVKTEIPNIDTVIIASQSRSDNVLYYELKKKGGREVYFVGDCVAPRTIRQCVLEAERMARRI